VRTDHAGGLDPVRTPRERTVLDASDPAALRRAAEALAAGEVVALPTDTVYGLAADPTNRDAVAALFELKGRPDRVPLPILVDGVDQAQSVAVFGDDADALAERFWPGPLTMVLDLAAGVVLHLGGTGTGGDDLEAGSSGNVGVRCPDHKMLRALCTASGPLAVSSANRHGEPPCTSAVQVLSTFDRSSDKSLPLVIDGGRCDGVVSTVLDLSGTEPRCLRHGAVPWSAVLTALASR